MDLIQKRNLAPVHPVKTFEASQVQDAFRYMQAGRHIGRIGVRIRDATGHLLLGSMGPHRPALTELDRNASYLVVGGLGGLGRATSVWMVEQGARSLIYLSRNVGAEENQFVRELEAMDCEVQIVRGSVECRGDVEKVIHKVKRPLKGILNMAMILRDDNFENMTLDQWNMVVGPKIQGTWNLHNATVSAGLDLDFFVLFSSLSGIIGQPGQTNYAAANSFLDAFVKFRRRQGLQASAIDLGAIQDIGYISRTPGLLQSLNQSGFRALREQEMLDAVALAMRPRETSPATTAPNARFLEDSSTFIVGLRSKVPLDSPSNRVVWKNDRRMAIYFNDTSTTNQQTSSSSDALKLFITSCRSDPSLLSNPDSASFIGREIGKKLLALLLKPQSDEINLGLSLADLGMDSLVAIELKGWWRGVFGFAISVLEMMGAGNLRTLGEIAVSGLGRAMESESVEANGSS